MQRLKRDAQLREIEEREKTELQRRRDMTEEERLKEDKKLGIGIFKTKEKQKWNFMQRYYHKGVFYMDESSVSKDGGDVRLRDYSEPTLEDHWDKVSNAFHWTFVYLILYDTSNCNCEPVSISISIICICICICISAASKEVWHARTNQVHSFGRSGHYRLYKRNQTTCKGESHYIPFEP